MKSQHSNRRTQERSSSSDVSSLLNCLVPSEVLEVIGGKSPLICVVVDLEGSESTSDFKSIEPLLISRRGTLLLNKQTLIVNPKEIFDVPTFKNKTVKLEVYDKQTAEPILV